MKAQRLFLLTLATVMVAAATARAAGEARAPGLVVTTENDLYANPFNFRNQDRHYSQGLKIMYIGGDKDFTVIAPPLNRWMPKLGLRDEACNVGFAIGQNMYTPFDTDTFDPVPGDEPYAGWLYGSFIFQRRGVTLNGIPTLDSYELALGVVGPAALGDVIQRQWHKWINRARPNGWEHQLKNEPAIIAKYARYWRLTPNEQLGRYFDFIPHVGADLGNIRIDANAGAFLRLGYNLPQDFGISLIDGPAPSIAPIKVDRPEWFSCYAFVGGEGRVVARDIFLDGNSFTDSLSVEKKSVVGDFMFGFGILLFQHVEASFTGVIRSMRFENQPGGRDAYGSVTIKAVFAI
ncbi:MAG: lipid A deacylase LpxR family protein [Verrucomicrobia bacterium]|nr:lipid A deacylase LpxR family protein [Verrucomicrobiota bacterium]